jgi:putative endonuclease
MTAVYIVRCRDGSLSTDDLEARVRMHNEGRGGRYTMQRRPVALVFFEQHEASQAAHARERQIKRWSGAKKESLVRGDIASLKELAISRDSARCRR